VVAGAAACKQAQQVCMPGVRSCSPLGGSIEECDAEGFGYRKVEDCTLNNCEVQGGQPVCPTICTAGELRCGPGRVEECEAGQRWRSKTSCGENLCVEAGGVPACLVCTPGALRCGVNNARTETCNAAGTGYTQVEACTGGSCTLIDGVPDCELPCTPGQTRCSALKNRVEVCDAAGTAFVADATCAGNTCIVAAGVAQCQPSPPECVEGQTRCSGIAVEQCGADGRYAAIQTCQSGCQLFAGEADCRPPVSAQSCTPNVRFCGGDNKVYSCNAQGNIGSVVRDCVAAGLACTTVAGAAQCVAPEIEQACTPNQQRCGADNKIYYCNGQGRLSGVRQDCAATGQTCAALGGAPQCVAPAIAQSCTPNKQFCGAGDNTIYYCDDMGQVSGVREVCGAGQVCGVEGNAAQCINGSYVTQPDGMMACVVSNPRTCGAVQKVGSTRGFVYAEVLKSACDAPSTVVRECGDRMECGGGACTSSVADTSSPYYEFSCPLVQQLALKTSLEADCRCLINNTPISGVEVCGRPFDRGTSGKRFGAGPSLVGLANGHYSGGFIEGDELIVAAYWGSSTAQRGLLVGIDVNTGDRRLISGDHNGTVRGAGPGFTYALDARKGPDNNYYVMTQSVLPSAPTIYRVNPTTGDRTVVWRGQNAAFGQCAAGDPSAQAQGIYVQYTNNGFAVDAQGAFYVGYANVQRDGRGVVKISANGQTCSFLTATGTRADGLTRGSGPELGGFVQGFTLRNNKLVVQITQPKSMLEIDLTTGNRTELITAQAAGIFGERWSVWDAARSVYWTAGLQGTVTIAAVDPARRLIMDIFSSCGTTEFPWYPLCAGTGPIRINSQNYGGIWMHPTNGNLLVAQDSVSIVEFEVATGNSVIRSL
jgi:hypothetical protein